MTREELGTKLSHAHSGSQAHDLCMEYINELDNRTCENCKHYKNEMCFNTKVDKMLDEWQEMTDYVKVDRDFGCNKWVAKDD